MRVGAVCTGRAMPIAAKSGMSGIDKRPAAGPVELREDGLEGDTIVDRDNHGGPDQAVLLVGSIDRAAWSRVLGRALVPGFFGENLLVEGLDTAALCLGDMLEIGAVRLQVTAPRVPCATFAARVGDPKAVRLFYEIAQPGAYARVLRTGVLAADMPVHLVRHDGETVGITENLEAYRRGFDDPTLLERMARTPAHAALHAVAKSRGTG